MSLLIRAAALLALTTPAFAEESLSLRFEVWEDRDTLEQALNLDFPEHLRNQNVVWVTFERPVELPDDLGRKAFNQVIRALVGGSLDIISLDMLDEDDPHAGIVIDLANTDRALAHRQRVMVDRLPDEALSLLRIFRPPANEGLAFMTRLEDLQGRNINTSADEFLRREEAVAKDFANFIAEIDAREAKIAKLLFRIDQLENTAPAAVDPEPVERIVKQRTPEDEETIRALRAEVENLRQALRRQNGLAVQPDAGVIVATDAPRVELLERERAMLLAQSEDLRAQIAELQAVLDLAAQRETEAQVRLATMGEQLNRALADLTRAQQEMAKE